MQPAPELAKVDWAQVNLPDGSYRWVKAKTYSWLGTWADAALVGALIEHPTFRDDYSSPGESSEVEDPVHGPYRLDAVTISAFGQITRDDAQRRFDEWLRDSASEEQSEAVVAAIETAVAPVSALLADGDSWYFLPELGEVAQHDFGFVLWHFREWIVLQHATRRLHTVACGLD